MADLDKRAAEAEKKLKELKKKIALRDAEKLKAEREAKIKNEARKNALFSEFALAGADPLLFVNASGQTFEKWLTLPKDREMFGLEPLDKPKAHD